MADPLPDQIRRARMRAGLSQEQLATHLSVTREQLSNYERGRCPNIPTQVTAAIAKALHERFEVDNCIIAPDGTIERSTVPQDQLCFQFDTEQVFPEATVKIRPSRETLLITATVPLRLLKSRG